MASLRSATVMDARQKLLDYGRPGLQYVRATGNWPSDPETYHMFLLSLYESLGQSAYQPTAAVVSPTSGATARALGNR